MLGLDYADHAPLLIDDRERMQVVFVEHFSKLVLVEVGRTEEDAGLGEDVEPRLGLGRACFRAARA